MELNSIKKYEIDWTAFYEAEERHRVVLPTYPFERKRHWIDPQPILGAAPTALPQPTQASETFADPIGSPSPNHSTPTEPLPMPSTPPAANGHAPDRRHRSTGSRRSGDP